MGTREERGATGGVPRARVPRFDADPNAFLRWAGRATGSDRLRLVTPATWRDGAGGAWRVVLTSEGIEVRPALGAPFLQFDQQPVVTALAIGRDLRVELTTVVARWVGAFAGDALDVPRLGAAMLARRHLPHDNLPLLFPALPTGRVARATAGVAVRDLANRLSRIATAVEHADGATSVRLRLDAIELRGLVSATGARRIGSQRWTRLVALLDELDERLTAEREPIAIERGVTRAVPVDRAAAPLRSGLP